MNNTEIFREIYKQELQGVQYAKGIIQEHQEQPAFQAESFWQAIVLDFLKKQTLNFVGKTLEHLKKQAISHLVDFAYWLLSNLEDYLVNQYQNISQEEKEIFLGKIKENFPQSNLLMRLEKE